MRLVGVRTAECTAQVKVRLLTGRLVWLKHFTPGEKAIQAILLLSQVAKSAWLETLGSESVQVVEIDVSAAELRALNGLALLPFLPSPPSSLDDLRDPK